MESGEEINKLIEEWRFLHIKGNHERHGKKPRIKELRLKFFELMGDKDILFLEGYVLQKQHHESYSTVAVWEKKKWNEAEQRRLDWEQQSLSWIK